MSATASALPRPNAPSLPHVGHPGDPVVGIMPRLYRHSLGAVSAPYYLPHFERFGSLGHVVPTWNYSAALFTLSWLIFRRMWRPAFAYLACVLSLLMLWWGGVHRRIPLPMEAALILGVLLVLCLVPGFMGNALYYRTVHNQTLRALAKSRTLAHAIGAMRRQAVTKARLYVISVLHIVLFGWLAWLVAMGVDWRSLHVDKPLPVQVQMGPPDLVIPTAASASRATTPPPLTPTRAADDTATSSGGSSLTAYPSSPGGSTAYPGGSPASGSAGGGAAGASAAYPGGGAGSASMAYPGGATGSSASNDPLPSLTALPMTGAPSTAPEAPPARTSGKQSVAESKAASQQLAAKPPRPAPDRKPRNALQPGKFYVNAGVYAQPGNAQRAATALREAAYPVISQPVQGTKGGLTRLRLGPFNSREEAAEASAQANLRNIDTTVFQQPR